MRRTRRYGKATDNRNFGGYRSPPAGTTAARWLVPTLRPDRGAGLLDNVLRRRVQLAHDLLHLGAWQRRNVDPHLVGVREVLRVLHGGVEARAQDRECLGRDARRRYVGALKHLLADDQLD